MFVAKLCFPEKAWFLGWIRKELAPYASDAYPDAYEEFKKLLLMFVFEEKDDKSPVSYEWSDASRQYLGELVYGTLKSIMGTKRNRRKLNLSLAGLKDPDLVNLLKYLLLHVGISDTAKLVGCECDEEPSPWVKKIYVRERMPAPMMLGEEPKIQVSDKDREAVEAALRISQAEASQALRRGKGDISAAFDSEIGRLKINNEELNHLVLEYAGYRLDVWNALVLDLFCRGLLQLSESESEENENEDLQKTQSDIEMPDVVKILFCKNLFFRWSKRV